MNPLQRLSAAGLLLLASAPLAAQPPRPLLRIDTRVETRAHGLLLSHEHFFVAKSGLVSGEIVLARQGSVGWEYQTYEDVAPRAVLAGLTRALADNQIGFIPEACTTDSGFRSTGTYELTWYGAGMRSRTLLIRLVSGTEANDCPPEVLDIARAIRRFLFDSVGASTTVVAP